MKKLFALSIVLLVSLIAQADQVGSKVPITQVRNVYSSTNVGTSSWVELVAATGSNVSAVEVFDSSGQTLEIGVGASGSEVVQFIIVPGGNGMLPLKVPRGSRVAVKALSGTANTGNLIINFYL